MSDPRTFRTWSFGNIGLAIETGSRWTPKTFNVLSIHTILLFSSLPSWHRSMTSSTVAAVVTFIPKKGESLSTTASSDLYSWTQLLTFFLRLIRLWLTSVHVPEGGWDIEFMCHKQVKFCPEVVLQELQVSIKLCVDLESSNGQNNMPYRYFGRLSSHPLESVCFLELVILEKKQLRASLGRWNHYVHPQQWLDRGVKFRRSYCGFELLSLLV